MADVDCSVEYREIPGFPLYRIGNDGSLWSKHNNRHGVLKKWKRLKGTKARHGYFHAALHYNGKITRTWVHRLVLLAFTGPCPVGMEVRHLDGNPSNNQLCNLKYGTSKENASDRVRHGTVKIKHFPGESHPLAKLTTNKVKEIRALYIKGSKTTGSTALARKYKVSQAAIWNVVVRNTWNLCH